MWPVLIWLVISQLATEQERYPNVYLAPGSTGSALGLNGTKMLLPVGTTREDKGVGDHGGLRVERSLISS